MARRTPEQNLAQRALPGIPSPIDRQLARLLSVQVSAEARLAFARSFTAAVVASTFKTTPPPDLSPIQAAAADQLGQAIAAAPPSQAAYLIGTIYTSALPEDHRARHGIFYTPPGVVDRLLDMAEAAGADWKTARILDPACGGGAFLLAAASRITKTLAGTNPALILKHLSRRLRGFELDPFGAWLAQAMLDAQLAGLAAEAGRPVPKMVETRDSLDLRTTETSGFDIVLGNPPYGRVTLPPGTRTIFARSTYGHANLYGLFTDAALRWAAPGGIVGYVTPTSMLSGLYHKALRALLVREAPPVAVDLVAERAGVFDDVLQETMLAIYRRSGPDPAPEPPCGRRVGFLALDADGRVRPHHPTVFSLPKDPEAPWLLPRAPDQVALTRRLRTMPCRIADYGFGVSTGPLVWNRFKPQLRATKGKFAYPVVWAESVTANGRFLWRAEKRNHAPWFGANLPRDAWLLIDRPCVLLQRTTAKEQPRRLIAAELPEEFLTRHGAAVIENHLNMVRPIVPTPAIPSAAIAALLNSAAADAAFRCINGSVAVSAFELEGMPVPPVATMRQVARLIAKGAAPQKIEALISAAYLTD